MKNMELTPEHKQILTHSMQNGLYCGDSQEMDELCEAELMMFVGSKPFVPDGYYKVTEKGKQAINS